MKRILFVMLLAVLHFAPVTAQQIIHVPANSVVTITPEIKPDRAKEARTKKAGIITCAFLGLSIACWFTYLKFSKINATGYSG